MTTILLCDCGPDVYITSRHRLNIEQMKKYFNNYGKWYKMKGDPQWAWMPAAKYNHDLFYLSPFYHINFPLDKLIVTNTDIEFKFSIDLLYAQFSLFSSNHIYSLGTDLTPFYADRLFNWLNTKSRLRPASLNAEAPTRTSWDVGTLQHVMIVTMSFFVSFSCVLTILLQIWSSLPTDWLTDKGEA